MLESLGAWLTALARRWMPDPFVLAILLTLVTFAGALAYTGFDVARVLHAWVHGSGKGQGFWNLLGFSMQMCLILVTGHALAASPPVQRGLMALAGRVHGPSQAIVVVTITTLLLSLVNWGLGLIGGAVLAREVGRRCRARGIPVHYPLLAAAGYTGLVIWHGGLSGSAPLKVTRQQDLVELLGKPLAEAVGPIPLGDTIGSLSNLLVTLVLLVLVPWTLVRMMPRDPAKRTAAPDFASLAAPAALDRSTPAARLDHSLVLVLLLFAAALGALVPWVREQGIGRIDLNVINFVFLFAGMLLHRSPVAYADAIGEGARGCGGIILQFPLYAGIIGLLAGTGLMGATAEVFAGLGARMLPVAGLLSAGVVNMFVPSGGGQWAVQGPILIEAALKTGVAPAKMVMALVYGDEWTNMLQPFWALPLLAITQVRAQDIMGYTAVLTFVTAIVFLVAVLI